MSSYDEGYDYDDAEAAVRARGINPHLRRRGEKPRKCKRGRPRRLVVERANSWHNAERRTPLLTVAVIVTLGVGVPVSVVALLNGTEIGKVNDAVRRSGVDELREHGHDALEQANRLVSSINNGGRPLPGVLM